MRLDGLHRGTCTEAGQLAEREAEPPPPASEHSRHVASEALPTVAASVAAVCV